MRLGGGGGVIGFLVGQTVPGEATRHPPFRRTRLRVPPVVEIGHFRHGSLFSGGMGLVGYWRGVIRVLNVEKWCFECQLATKVLTS